MLSEHFNSKIQQACAFLTAESIHTVIIILIGKFGDKHNRKTSTSIQNAMNLFCKVLATTSLWEKIDSPEAQRSLEKV